jgi:DNA-binding transcriptional ArsR family regulator
MAGDVYKAIGDPTRRALLDLLAERERPVEELVARFGVTFSAISQHLSVLHEAGLVSRRAEGRRRLYRLDPSRLRPFHAWLAKYERAMNDRLDRVGDYLKELQQEGEQL